jgi:RNA polymerase sigma-70 factor (ECF subfamily)
MPMSQSLEAAVGGFVRETDQPDRDAEFEALLADSGALAFRVAHGVLRHREDAEDVAQEALARAYRSFGRLRDRSRFRSWLVRITWRLALDHQRAAARRTRREQEASDVPDPPDVEEVAQQNEFQERLWRAIGDLPEKLRQVVILAGILGHDLRAVGELLGVPHGTVRSRMHTARKRLAEALR